MKTLYEKVEIKSEQDLPKESGKYFVLITDNISMIHGEKRVWKFKISSVGDKSIWLAQVDWYLQPVEPQEAKQTAEEILKDFLDKDEAQDAEVTGSQTYLSTPDVLILMKRAPNQQPEISDEEIELYFINHFGDEWADKDMRENALFWWTRSAKWLRDKLKSNG